MVVWLTKVSSAPRASGNCPGVAGEPGKMFFCWPVFPDVCFLESYDFELITLWIFKQLNGDPFIPNDCVISMGERKATVYEVGIYFERNFVSTGSTQEQVTTAGGGATRMAVFNTQRYQEKLKHKRELQTPNYARGFRAATLLFHTFA